VFSGRNLDYFVYVKVLKMELLESGLAWIMLRNVLSVIKIKKQLGRFCLHPSNLL